MFFFFFIQLFYILFLFLFFFSSFYFLFFDFCLFIIKPYLHFFSSLISNYFFFTSSNLPLMHYYKQNYIKICFNVILQHEEVYSYAIPDFLFVEYNPFFSLGIYLFIFFLLLFLYFFFFYSSLSIFFVWFGCIRILLYYLLFHYVLVPFKLFQLSYDFLELETLFNLQFSINYYFMFYFVCLFLFILFMEFPFYFSLKYFIKRLLYIFILLLSFYVYDPFNFSYFTLNVNGYSFIYSYVICLILLEIFIFLNNVFIKLEMTGIEPAWHVCKTYILPLNYIPLFILVWFYYTIWFLSADSSYLLLA